MSLWSLNSFLILPRTSRPETEYLIAKIGADRAENGSKCFCFTKSNLFARNLREVRSTFGHGTWRLSSSTAHQQAQRSTDENPYLSVRLNGVSGQLRWMMPHQLTHPPPPHPTFRVSPHRSTHPPTPPNHPYPLSARAWLCLGRGNYPRDREN